VNGLHDALDDIAAEVSPADPPLGAAMRRGRRLRRRRLTAAVAGTTAAVALIAGGVIGLPALAGQGSPAGRAVTPAGGGASGDADAPLARPVLLEKPRGSATEYGSARLVTPATLTRFRHLTCQPSPNPLTVNDRWKASASYSGTGWNAPGSQVVSCDSSGTRYVLGPAVVRVGQVTSVAWDKQAHSTQWVVTLSLNGQATKAFGTLTTRQFNTYYARAATDQDAAVLDSVAILLNGNVQSDPQIQGALTTGQFTISGPAPDGFTQAQAQALAARL
jgi:hypothetical protein